MTGFMSINRNNLWLLIALLIAAPGAVGQDHAAVHSTFDALEAIAAEPPDRFDEHTEDEDVMAAAVAEKPRVAVFEFKVRGNLSHPDAGAIVSEWMNSSLAETQRFTLMERALLDQILEEQEFQSSYLSDDSTMVEAGKLFGVEAIVSGTLSQWGRTISISARLIDTSTGVVRAAAQVTTQSEDDIPHQIGLLAWKLAESTQPEGSERDVTAISPPENTAMIARPAWLSVRVQPHERLHLGDEMRLEISSARAGELLVVDIDPRGSIAQIFPYPSMTPCGAECRLRPNDPMVIPSPFDGIRFAAREPTGTGHILAILSEARLEVDDLEIDIPVSGDDDLDSVVRVQLAPGVGHQQDFDVWVAEVRYTIAP